MKKSRGAVLAISLVLLLVLSLIGVTAMRSAAQGEHVANNTRQRDLAFQAAEAALRVGEEFIRTAPPDAFDGNTVGAQPQPVDIGTLDIPTFWLCPFPREDCYNWPGIDPAVNGGARTVTLSTTLGNSQPLYVMEKMAVASSSGGGSLQAGAPVANLPGSTVYRVTARGTGAITDAVVILQSIYRN